MAMSDVAFKKRSRGDPIDEFDTTLKKCLTIEHVIQMCNTSIESALVLSNDVLRSILQMLLAENIVRLSMCSPLMQARIKRFELESFVTGSEKYAQMRHAVPANTRLVKIYGKSAGINGFLATLPHSVQSLHVCNGSWLEASILAYLPPNLTSICLRNVSGISAAGFGYLPRTLTELECSGGHGQCFEANSRNASSFGKLPAGMTRLNLDWEFADNVVALLPRSLKILELTDSVLTSACIPHLPPGLTRLNVWSLKFGNYLESDTRYFCQLPSSLVHLECPALVLRRHTIADLPRNLTHLIIKKIRCLDHEVSLLPPQLLHLRCKTAYSKQLLKISCACFEHLPRSLTILHLPGLYMNDESHFASLSRSLKHLNILSPHSTDASTSIVTMEHLPSALVTIRFMRTQFGNVPFKKCLADMPSTLIGFFVEQAWDAVNNDLECLPPKLRYLELAGARKLSNDCTHYLPKTLLCFSTPDSPNIHAPKLPPYAKHYPSTYLMYAARSSVFGDFERSILAA